MLKNCLFGTYRASAIKNYSAPMSSEYPATIRIDKNEGRTACLPRSRLRVGCSVYPARSLSDMELSPNEDLYAVRTL
jgi:hypothetical protein